MATNNESMTRQIGKLTLTITDEGAEFKRVFDAPRRLVWEALSKAEHYPKWWGVRSETMVSCDFDFRVGGKYRFVTRGAEGVDNAFRGEFREIVPQERLVQTFEYEGYPGSITLDAMDLAEEGDRTIVTVKSTIEAGEAAAFQAMVDSGMAEGAAETYDRLEELAQQLAKR
jgi:uncharacterized protein YndB with AHSA1/START domain